MQAHDDDGVDIGPSGVVPAGTTARGAPDAPGAPTGQGDPASGHDGGAPTALLERLAVAVLVVDDELVVRFANPAAGRLHGVDAAERLVGRAALALVPPDEHDVLRTAVGEVLARGVRQGRRRVLSAAGRPDESVRLVDEHATAIVWEGRPAVLSTLSDVTEDDERRSRALAARRPVAQLARAAVGFVQVLPSGVVAEANPAAAALAGRPSLTGVRVLELVAPGDRPAVDHLLRTLLAPGDPALASVPPVSDVRLRVPDGTTRPCRLSGFRLGEPGTAGGGAGTGGPLAALVLVDDADRSAALQEAGARAERTAALLRAVPDALVVCGRDGTVLQVNDQAEHLFGWAADELVGQPIEVLVPGARQPGHRRLRDQYVGTPHARPMFTGAGIAALRKDGTEVPVEVNLAAAVLDGESVVVASVRDTSEQRRVQEALQASHDLVTGVLGAATEQAILAMDLEGRLELFSRGAERLLGYRAEEVLGGPASRFDHPDADLRATWGLAPGEPLHERIQALVGTGVSSTRPWAYRTKDGGRREVLLSVTVRPGPTGPNGLIVVATDITAQLVQEEELAASRQRFEAAFTHAPVGVALVDVRSGSAGRFLQVNEAMTRMLGYTEAELLDASLAALAHPDDAGLAEAGFAGLAATVRSDVVEHRFLHADGHDVWVEVSFAAVQDGHGSPDYAVCMMNDVTDRKRAEAELVHNALHDALTGLPNRALLTEHLHQALARSRSVGAGAGVLYIDLDNFKDVNDSLGHAAGDQLLAAVAERLLGAVRERTWPAGSAVTSSSSSARTSWTPTASPPSPSGWRARCRSRSPWETGPCRSRRASGWPTPPGRTPGRRSCCARPTSPCTGPRPTGAGASSSRTPVCRRGRCASSSSRRTCGRRSSSASRRPCRAPAGGPTPSRRDSSSSTTSRASTPRTAAWSPARPCCAGGTPRVGCCRPGRSSTWPRSGRSWCRSAPGCCGRRARRPRAGGTPSATRRRRSGSTSPRARWAATASRSASARSSTRRACRRGCWSWSSPSGRR
ncbi:hypothetical protein Cma02nite_01730 [Cellulomonas marina]|nr:hypothetical protein Cma02nite_01730 [Cellulomonas marina]